MADRATGRLAPLRRNPGFALLFWATAGSAIGTYLAALALSLRLAEAKLETSADEAAQILVTARAELFQALEELRELARGLHPNVLTDRGLGPALEALVARSPDDPGRPAPEQLDQPIPPGDDLVPFRHSQKLLVRPAGRPPPRPGRGGTHPPSHARPEPVVTRIRPLSGNASPGSYAKVETAREFHA